MMPVGCSFGTNDSPSGELERWTDVLFGLLRLEGWREAACEN